MAKEVADGSPTLKNTRWSELIGLHRPGNTFVQDVGGYFRLLGRTPQNLMERAAHVPLLAESQAKISLDERRGELRKELIWFDLMNLGIGNMLGAGIFVTTGTVANGYSGGATVMSYLIAGISALFSGLCYSEFGTEYPVAGGSFVFILYTFGEFWSWITATNIIFNYILANAAVARNFTPYLGSLCNQGDNFLIIVSGSRRLDFGAMGLVLVLTVLLCWGIKETKTANNIITVAHVAVVIFIIIAGFTQAEASNFTYGGWAPFGARGVWNGASLVFFSYIGFDAVATVAEEVKNPARDIPIGMVASLTVITTLYLLAAVMLDLMLPYTLIDPSAAFSKAFITVGMHWAAYIVAIGALLGIVTGVLVGSLAVTRGVTALGRENFLPPIAAVVSHRLGTPIFATAILGIVTAIIALFTAFDSLLNLVSVCTLFTFYVIACGILYRRYHLPGKTKPWLALFAIFYFTAVSVGLSAYYEKSSGWVGLAVPGILWAIGVVALFLCPQAYHPKGFAVPFMPLIPAGSIILNLFLLGTLPKSSWQQWGEFIAAMVGVYVLFSVPSITLNKDIESPAVKEAIARARAEEGYKPEVTKGEVEMADDPAAMEPNGVVLAKE